MLRSFLRKVGVAVLSISLLLGSYVSFPTPIAHAASEGDFEYEDLGNGTAKITRYVGPGGNVVIPGQLGGLNVIQIGNNAFINKLLTSVTIPNSVTNIEEAAFADNQLTSVKLPDNLVTVEALTFRNNQLTSVDHRTSGI